MKKAPLFSAALAVAAAALAGCGGDANSSSNTGAPVKIQAPAKVAPLSEAQLKESKGTLDSQKQLAQRLAGELVAAFPDQNVMVSPWSLSEAFGMLRLGATGKTDEELARFLGTKGSPGEVAKSSDAVRKGLIPLAAGDVFRQANALFVKRGEPIEKTFVDQLTAQYQATVRETSFPEPGLGEVNAFVKEATRDKIPKLFEELSADTIAVLVNAISFKDKWSEPFEKSMTEDRDFFPANGAAVKVPMMSQTGSIAYTETKQFQSVSLSYQSRLRMVLLLPQKGIPLKTVLGDAKAWAAAMKPAGELKEGTIFIPRWKSEFTWDLQPWMVERGFGRVFDPELAELRGIRKTGENLFVMQAIQKTFVQVDEEGTEAAAATGIVVGVTSAPMEPEPTFNFVADRPFAYAILTPEGLPLFVGVVANPSVQ